ncbi:MAG: FAD-dependent oxidoreductase, partial [Acidobacteriota bacterium]|nr:FAD-dependent oxidoreductase [Acidobacteriota bacterium]
RTRAEMPAQDEELCDLLDEGGRLVELTAPKALVTPGGRLERVEMWKMQLGKADSSGRMRPEIVPGAEFEAELDSLIVAIGQLPDLRVFKGEDIALNRSGFLEVDPATLETSLPGVYAGGDIIGGGPASIVKAAGDGRKIAEAILALGDHSTATTRVLDQSWPAFDGVDLLRRRARTEPRVAIAHLPAADRKGFEEVVLTLSPEDAADEAARCLDCDVMCSTCDGVCPNRAILTYRTTPGDLELPTFSVREGRLSSSGRASFRVDQGPQVAVLSDACNECGNCVTFCPTAGQPWRDKPRLYFHRGDFEDQGNNAFMLLRHGGLRGIQARFEDKLHELFDGDTLSYRSPYISLSLDPETLEVVEATTRAPDTPDQTFDPALLGAMITLLRSLTRSMPELPVIEADPGWLLVQAG